MAKFRVGVLQIVMGETFVEANSNEEAINKVKCEIPTDAIYWDEIDTGDFEIKSVEEIEKFPQHFSHPTDKQRRIARLYKLTDKINELARLEPRLVDDTDWHSNMDAIEQMICIIEDEDHVETNKLAEEALNIAVKHIHDKLGIKDGDMAGQFFSDGVAHQELYDYILMEEK